MSKPIKNNFKLEAFYEVENTLEHTIHRLLCTLDKNRECGKNLRAPLSLIPT